MSNVDFETILGGFMFHTSSYPDSAYYYFLCFYRYTHFQRVDLRHLRFFICFSTGHYSKVFGRVINGVLEIGNTWDIIVFVEDFFFLHFLIFQQEPTVMVLCHGKDYTCYPSFSTHLVWTRHFVYCQWLSKYRWYYLLGQDVYYQGVGVRETFF